MNVSTLNRIPSNTPSRSRNLLRRLGVAGFSFFLIKGLLWLLIPAVLVLFRG